MALVSDIDKPDKPWAISECEQILTNHAKHLDGEAAAQFINSALAMLTSVATSAGLAKGKYEHGEHAFTVQYNDWLEIREALDSAHDAYVNDLAPDEGDEDDEDEGDDGE